MNLTAVRFDKRTQHFDPKEEKYWLHFLATDKRDSIVQDYVRSQLYHDTEYRKRILKQPVCSKCEGFAFHHRNGVMCPTCGHWTPYKTHSVKTHLKEGHYR